MGRRRAQLSVRRAGDPADRAGRGPFAADQTPQFGASVGWSFLLTSSVGGPPSDLGLRVELPDPAQSARLDSFVSSAATAPAERPVTVATEQAVLQYDHAHLDAPLAARYPSASDQLLGSPELDYPYVLTTSDPLLVEVSRLFERTLKQSYAASVIRYYGFRSADGTGDAAPSGYGLSSQLLSVAALAGAGETQATLKTWGKLGLGFNDLVLIDTSAAMNRPSGAPGLTLEQGLVRTAELGLALFPDSARMSLWEFSDQLSGQQPYRQLVSVGPLPEELGLISRRQQLEQIDQTLQASPTAPAALNDTILAAYKQMLAGYQPGDANTLVVLASGVDNAAGDLPLASLLAKLRALYNPNRRVQIVAIMFGSAGNFPALQQIASITGGTASQITSPSQVARVFFAAIADRTCNPACTAP